MIKWHAKEVKAGWWFHSVLLLHGSVKIYTEVLIPRDRMNPTAAWDCIAKMQVAMQRRREEHEATHA